MKKYQVLQRFIDANTREVYEVGSVIKLTDERAEEIRENLAAYGEFIEEVADKPKGKGKDKDKEADKTDETGEANGENEKDNAANDVEADKKEKEAE
ncbi:hypothetical protein NHG29_04190 [Aerococcaceae bacterium NML160702]|nr:hypothetical protein [Aerococcaceae bacterium NML160702]